MDERAKLERLTFFSDAVFAIAMTLLVIEVRVPHLAGPSEAALGQALLDLLPNYIGFAISFVVIARFWLAHHRMMGMLHSADTRLVIANLALLMSIAFMPFPTAVLSDYALMRVSVGVYAGYLVVVGLANVRFVRAAIAGRRLVRADAPEQEIARLTRSMWQPLWIGAIAFVAGMVSPPAGLAALTIGTPIVAWVLGERRARRVAEPVHDG